MTDTADKPPEPSANALRRKLAPWECEACNGTGHPKWFKGGHSPCCQTCNGTGCVQPEKTK